MTIDSARRLPRWRTWASCLAVCACSALAAVGCNIVAPAAYLVEGPPTVPAMYILPNKATVVFVDDRLNVVNPATLRVAIGDAVAQTLLDHKVLTRTISSRDVMAMVRQRERSNQLLSIEEIGKSVGAEQVIYVEMLAFHDTPDGVTPQPESMCRIRVTDVVNNVRLFPAADSNEAFHTVHIKAREVDAGLYGTRATRLKIAQLLADETGRRIAETFYEHETVPLGSSSAPKPG